MDMKTISRLLALLLLIPSADGFAAEETLMKHRIRLLSKSKDDTYNITFSADGRRIAFIPHQDAKNQYYSGVRVCALEASDCLDIPFGATFIDLAALSPDGLTVAATDDGKLKAWSAVDGRLLYEIQFRSGGAHQLVFSPDGKSLAVAHANALVEIHDARTGELRKTLEARHGGVGLGVTRASSGELSVNWAPPSLPAGKAGIKHGDILRSVDGKDLAKLDIHEVRRLLSGTIGTEVKLGVRRAGKSKESEFELERVEIREPVEMVSFTPDGQKVVGMAGSAAWTWSLETGQAVSRSPITGASDEISPDGAIWTTLRADKTIEVRSTADMSLLKSFPACASFVDCPIQAVFPAPGGRLLASLESRDSSRPRLTFYGVEEGKPVLGPALVEDSWYSARQVVFSPDGRFFAVTTSQSLQVFRNTLHHVRFVTADSAELTNAAGKALTKLPKGTAVDILRSLEGSVYVRIGQTLKGYVRTDEVSLIKPDIMNPVVRVTEKEFREPLLRIKGVAYDDVVVASVSAGSTKLPRAPVAADRGNYEDAYPFEGEVALGPGMPLSIRAVDASGRVTEIPINIEDAVQDYAPRYVQIETLVRAEARKAPAPDAEVLTSFGPKTVLAVLGEKDGWYYLEGGGWLPVKEAKELEVYASASSRPLVFSAAAEASAPKALRAASDVNVEIPAAAAPAPDAVAVVIGVRDYKNKDVPAVEYALEDARTVKQYLVRAFGFSEGNILYLENPTQGDLARVFGTKESPKGQLSHYVKAGKSDVFVYYSGHGAPDLETQTAFLVPSDAHPDYVRLNGYPLELFYANLAALPARSRTVVIDACFSGSSHKGMLLAKASPLVASVESGAVPKGLTVLTSASNKEVSSWYEEKGHSLFTYFFLKGVQESLGKGLPVTAGTLKSYLDETVPFEARKRFGRSQTPQLSGDAGRPFLK